MPDVRTFCCVCVNRLSYDGCNVNWMVVAVDAHMQVMEYVQERASLYELTKAVKSWERKVEISEVRHQPM